jgi:arginine decarboxylase
MRIPIVAATGGGRTLLSSFDDALRRCGVHNYNLLPLSSVIPPGSEVTPDAGYRAAGEEHGHRLYVVKADARSDVPGQAIAAGIGWYQWGDGRGVFVEHETHAATAMRAEIEVRALISDSLRDLCAFRGIPFEERRVGSRVQVATVDAAPTTVLVLAVYRAEGWG